MSSASAQLASVIAISTALLGAGAIACLSLFDVPILQAQPASRSLPSIRWLFSRGSHVFPSAAGVASTAFAFVAYNTAAPIAAAATAGRTVTTATTLVSFLSELAFSKAYATPRLYALAAALSISIYPFTTFIMIPLNFSLIKLNNMKGGFASSDGATAAKLATKDDINKTLQRSAQDSVNGVGELDTLQDLSGPQDRTWLDTSAEEDATVRERLERFKWLNMTRAVLLGSGGIVGLATALAK
ncbi:hypothetical protein HDU88_005243 [Geranomyces variabilis]|nr:hypothetical protein HDU88_005243 [Geranomyces variabilis]